MTQYLIIGSGAAGISAAEAIRKLDAGGEITLVSKERDGYYSRPGLAYLLTGEIPEKQLYPFSWKDFQRLRLRLVHDHALQILPHQHQVMFQSGKRMTYDRLLIATGARAAMVRLPGVELQGVVKLDTLGETRKLLKLARKGRRAVIVGGGITALEMVEGLRARGVRVDYFLRGERYWSNVLDETESHIVEQRLKEEGIGIHHHTELAEFLGKNGRVVGVRTTDGYRYKCDLVGVAIGVTPNKELGEAAGLQVEKGIVVDEFMRTNLPNIYAAGDVAQVYDPRLNRAIVDSLWEPARAQGRTAGLNMVGRSTRYSKGVPFNVTRLAGLTTTIIGYVNAGHGDPDVVGIVRGDSEGWRQTSDGLAVQYHCDVNRLRVLVGETHLIGGVVMGDQLLSKSLHQLISGQVDIRPIRQRLLDSDISIEKVLVNFVAGNKG